MHALLSWLLTSPVPVSPLLCVYVCAEMANIISVTDYWTVARGVLSVRTRTRPSQHLRLLPRCVMCANDVVVV